MRIIFYFLLLFLFLYFFLSLLLPSHKKNGGKSDSNNNLGTEMVKDPNCQIYIQKSESIKYNIKGKMYYFCSDNCAKEFKKDLKRH